MGYHSQDGQDVFLYQQFFRDRRARTFVEVGALDGLLHSNTLFFERELEWRGVLVEPNPVAFALLERNRPNCNIENVAVSDRDEMQRFTQITGDLFGWSGLSDNMEDQHRDRINRLIPNTAVKELEVRTISPATLLAKHRLDHVDLMSIDTEGSEEKILKAFPWGKVQVSVFCIENNFGNTAIMGVMSQNGYQRVAHIGSDDIYVHGDFYPRKHLASFP